MAGLWERVKPNATDRMPSHALYAAMTLYAEGVVSQANLMTYLNSQVSSPLAGDEMTDLVSMRNKIDGESTLVLKHRWINIFHAINIAVESDSLGLMTEAAWRSKLGI